jgi:hypothetical protein
MAMVLSEAKVPQEAVGRVGTRSTASDSAAFVSRRATTRRSGTEWNRSLPTLG